MHSPQVRRATSFAVAATLASATLLAQAVVDDFEHGNEALWVAQIVGFDTLDVLPDAAHDGALGGQLRQTAGNATWRARFDLVSTPGTTYRWFVRSRGTATTAVQFGRSYLGVAATTGGALVGTFAPNSSQMLLQSVTGWPAGATIATLDSASAPIQQDTWYVMQLEWAVNGDVTLTLLDEPATSVIAQVGPTATTFTAPGGFAMRGFTQNTGAFHDLDTLTEVVPPVGTNYCGPAATNSTGVAAHLSGSGSAVLASNALVLSAEALPPNSFGFFLTSRTQSFVANPGGSQGNLCLGGGIGRYVQNIFNSGAAGRADLQVDATQMPTPNGLVGATVGETWSFQAWYRDANPAVTSNFTDGLEVTFL
jgi:hypothetical protein